MNIGIIGCGGMGTHHARAINDMGDVVLAGLSDTIEEKATSLAGELHTEAYTDFHDLIPDVDGVMICTRPSHRSDIVLDCAEAGLHIFAEKPIALDLAAADRMIEVTGKAGVTFMIGYVLRFTQPFKIIRETLASGELGRLVNCWTRRYMPVDMSGRWYGEQSQSGGITLDFASHDIDWLQWVGGDARTAFGKVDRVRSGIEADEHVHALLTFDDGVGSVDCTWLSTIGGTSIGLVGSEGSMIVSDDGEIRKKVGEEEEETVTPEAGETIQEHFVRCIREGATPKVTGHDARGVLATVLAIQESARTGQAVVVG